MRTLAAIFVALAVFAQHEFVRAEEFFVEEASSGENGAAGVAGEVADTGVAGATGDAGGRKLLYAAPQIVTTTAPAGVDCAWGAWSAWSTCYQNAYSKDEPLRCNLGVSRRTRTKTTFQTLNGTCPETVEDCAANSLLRAKNMPCTHYDEVLCNIGTGMTPVAPFPPTINATTGLASGYRPCPVDCVLSAWGAWSQCDATCGQYGIQYRKRSVQVPPQPESYFTDSTSGKCETAVLDGNDDYKGDSSKLTGFPCGSPCRGNLTEVRSCFRKECPVDCVWSNWSPWSGCSKLCDGGSQHRTRYVKEPPQHGGKLCKATACSETSGLCTTMERRKCNEVSCSGKRIREKQDDASVDQDLCQYKAEGSVDCPANETRTGGAHTAVGANPRPNDPVQSDCLADKSCKDSSMNDLFEAK